MSTRAGKGDNTDVDGELRLQKSGDGTKITLRQMLAPDTPVPALLQRLVRVVRRQGSERAAAEYLANVKQALEAERRRDA